MNGAVKYITIPSTTLTLNDPGNISLTATLSTTGSTVIVSGTATTKPSDGFYIGIQTNTPSAGKIHTAQVGTGYISTTSKTDSTTASLAKSVIYTKIQSSTISTTSSRNLYIAKSTTATVSYTANFATTTASPYYVSITALAHSTASVSANIQLSVTTTEGYNAGSGTAILITSNTYSDVVSSKNEKVYIPEAEYTISSTAIVITKSGYIPAGTILSFE